MDSIKYVKLSEVSPHDFISLLNNQRIREHLIDHELFDIDIVKKWIQEKIKVDSTFGCNVRAIIFNNQLAGWCGIQLEDEKYEIAIVLDNKSWGLGKEVFNEIMRWAKEFKHDEIFIHFLHTRPEYKFLKRLSKNVFKSEILGNKFTTYQLAVN
jgi:hypothetical protein